MPAVALFRADPGSIFARVAVASSGWTQRQTTHDSRQIPFLLTDGLRLRPIESKLGLTACPGL